MSLDKHDKSWKNIWRNARCVSPEEQWKWNVSIWELVQEQIWYGDIEQLICPICHQENVYFEYRVFAQVPSGLLADRWVGCENCEVQLRDTSFVPEWLENPEWH